MLFCYTYYSFFIACSYMLEWLMVMPNKLLKIGENARLLGVSTSMVRLYVKQGRLVYSLTPSGQRSLMDTAKGKLDG